MNLDDAIAAAELCTEEPGPTHFTVYKTMKMLGSEEWAAIRAAEAVRKSPQYVPVYMAVIHGLTTSLHTGNEDYYLTVASYICHLLTRADHPFEAGQKMAIVHDCMLLQQGISRVQATELYLILDRSTITPTTIQHIKELLQQLYGE